MKVPRKLFVTAGTSVLLLSGFLIVRADDGPSTEPQLTISHPDCDYFGSQREKFATGLLAPPRTHGGLSTRTAQVRSMMAATASDRTNSFARAHSAGTIDYFIEADFKANGITPAAATT